MVAATSTDTVSILSDGTTTYHVVGTAHVSERSVAEVREVIHRIKPEVVCVELCKGRFDALTQDRAFRDLDIFKVVREGKGLYLLAHLALASYQRKMGAALGVKPGAELLAAIEAANEVGARVELVDRDINVTLKRTWANIGLWKKSQLLASVMVGFEDDSADKKDVTADDIEKLKEGKALAEMLTELSRVLPQVKTPLIDERDQYLMSGIESAGKGNREVVAVVGAAHVPGMKTWFGKVVDRETLGQAAAGVAAVDDRQVDGPGAADRRPGVGLVPQRQVDRRARADLGAADLGLRRARHPARRRQAAQRAGRVHRRPTGRAASADRHRHGGRRGRGLAAPSHRARL
jgi:hypothetical protein